MDDVVDRIFSYVYKCYVEIKQLNYTSTTFISYMSYHYSILKGCMTMYATVAPALRCIFLLV